MEPGGETIGRRFFWLQNSCKSWCWERGWTSWIQMVEPGELLSWEGRRVAVHTRLRERAASPRGALLLVLCGSATCAADALATTRKH
jgi:hypothetical protein